LIVDRSLVCRILIIKLRAVGDVLLSTIVTKNLRLTFPDAQIDYLTESPSVDILAGNPFLDHIHVHDRMKMTGARLVRFIRSQRYDLVIDLFGNPRTALVTRLSGARYRLGYRFRGRTYAYNIMAEPRGAHVHNTQFNLDTLAAIGVAIQDRNIYFQFNDEDSQYVDEFLSAARVHGKFLVGVNTGGGWYTKRWGLDRFAQLADILVESFGATIVLTWGPGQLPEVEKIQALMKHKGFVPPATTLKQLGALLKQCRFVISNDSGPMHIAAAVGTPVLGIYGPTNPILQGPFGEQHITVSKQGLDCLGCNLTKCPIGHPCMLDLSVDTVIDGVQQLLKKNNLFP
jgi:predicted lipopolysaccharide heptosyltransferase III